MRVYITSGNRISVGGGWTFNQNLKNGLKDKVEFVDNVNQADIFLIAGLTQVDKNEVELAKELGLKIIFRVDNIPKPSRNRGLDVVGKLKYYSSISETTIYQSAWARKYAGYYSGDGTIIYNGVDTKLFNKNGDKILRPVDKTIYLFVNHSSNENKRFEEAKYIFSMLWRENKNSELWLVGRFEGKEYNYDFVDGEVVRDLGVVEDRNELAKIYRSADKLIYPAFIDACPNVVLEARASGLEIIGVNPEGGSVELLSESLDISLDRMCDEYYALFNLIHGENF